MGKGKGSTDEYPFMQTPDLPSHFLHLGYTPPLPSANPNRVPARPLMTVLVLGNNASVSTGSVLYPLF